MLRSGAGSSRTLSSFSTQHELSIAPPSVFFCTVQTQHQPIKELKAIKCWSTKIITSLLHSIESPGPKSILSTHLSLEECEKIISFAQQDKNQSPESIH